MWVCLICVNDSKETLEAQLILQRSEREMGGPETETPAVVVDTPVEPLNEEVVKKTKEAAKDATKDANGNVEETNGEGKDANGNVEEAKEARDETGEKQTKTVLSVVTKLKEDTKLSDR